MIFTTKYSSFWTRVRREFLTGFLIVTAIMFYSFLEGNYEIGAFEGMILAFGSVYLIYALFRAKTFVNEVKIMDDKIILTGYDFGKRWDKEIDVRTSDIRIKSKGRGRGNVEYYLRIVSPDRTIDINRSFTWDYPSLLTIFREFKRIKGEKIIFDESYFLDMMEKK